MPSPFFIVGNPRSGTTLLRFILSSHSNLYIPEETGFLPHLSQYRGRTLSDSEIDKLVAQIGDMNHEWHNLVTDLSSFRNQLSGRTLTDVLDGLYREKIKPFGASRWGDKGPSYVSEMDEIDRIFPDGLFIHMIRDGRDCCVSAMKKWGHQHWYFDTAYLMHNWRRNVTSGEASGARLGTQRYLPVRYEQLVTQTESTVRQICEFLGEPFEPDLLEHTQVSGSLADKSGHYETKRKVNRASIGNWRHSMSDVDQRIAQRIAGAQLTQLGYEEAARNLTPVGWLRYFGLTTKCIASSTARRILYRIGALKMSSAKRRK